jgi:hypothetical protein
MKHIKLFDNAINLQEYYNSSEYVTPSLLSEDYSDSVYMQLKIPAKIGDIVYYDILESKLKTCGPEKYTDSLGDPIGIVVIPEKVLPDKKARFISIYGAYSTLLTFFTSTYVFPSIMKKYPKVVAAFASGGYVDVGRIPSDFFTGSTCSSDSLVKYKNVSGTILASPYLYGLTTQNKIQINPIYSTPSNIHGNAFSDFNGLKNTKQLCDFGGNEFLAAYCAYNMNIEYNSPSNIQWYLPSLGELGCLLTRVKTINDSVANSGVGTLINTSLEYWSSTIASDSQIWKISFTNGTVATVHGAFSKAVLPFAILE